MAEGEMNTATGKHRRRAVSERLRPDPLPSWVGAGFSILLCLPGTLYLFVRFAREVLLSVFHSPWTAQKVSRWEGSMLVAALYGIGWTPIALVLTLFLTFRGQLPIRIKFILWAFLVIAVWGFFAAGSELR